MIMFYAVWINFVDSIRTMGKYSGELPLTQGVTLDAKMDRYLKQCCGQRNFYITGFSLFLMM